MSSWSWSAAPLPIRTGRHRPSTPAPPRRIRPRGPPQAALVGPHRDAQVPDGGALGDDAVHGQFQPVGPEHRAVIGYLHRVRLAAVVEAWLDLDREPHAPPDDPDVPHQPVPLRRRALDDRHEVVPVRRDLVETAAPGIPRDANTLGESNRGQLSPLFTSAGNGPRHPGRMTPGELARLKWTQARAAMAAGAAAWQNGTQSPAAASSP